MITASEAKHIAELNWEQINTDFFQKNTETTEIVLSFIYEKIQIHSQQGGFRILVPMVEIYGFYGLDIYKVFPPGFNALFRVLTTDLQINGYKVREGNDLTIDWS